MVEDKLENKRIAIIGTGHMGTAILEGLLKSGFEKENIILSCLSEERRTLLKNKYQIRCTLDNRRAVKWADWIILSVKPSVIKGILSEVKNEIKSKVIISSAAVVTVESIVLYTNNTNLKIIRIMPNLMVEINKGIIGIYTNRKVAKREKQQIINWLEKLGFVFKVAQESDLDKITLFSGCGPAIICYLIELYASAGLSINLPRSFIKESTLALFRTTLQYLEEKKLNAKNLQTLVATKGGITEVILNEISQYKWNIQLGEAVKVGRNRIDELKRVF